MVVLPVKAWGSLQCSVACEFTQITLLNQPCIMCAQTRKGNILLTLELTFPACLVPRVHTESPVVLSVPLLFMSVYTTFFGSTGGAAAGRLPE